MSPSALPTAPPLVAHAHRLTEAAATILDACGAILDTTGSGPTYERRVLTHGTTLPVQPNFDGQLAVSCARVFIGRAGEEQFAFASGKPGAMAYRTAEFIVQVTRRWPVQGREGLSPASIAAAADALWSDAWLVYVGLVALGLGGWGPSPTALGLDGMLVGTMVPKDPAGGEASWLISVMVQV